MPNLLPVNNPAVYLIIGLIILWVFSALVFLARRRPRLSEATYKALESQEKADRIIQKAAEEARQILTRAELEQNAIVSNLRLISEKTTAQYQKQMEAIFSQIKESMITKTAVSQDSYNQYVKELETRMATSITDKQKELGEKTDAFFAEGRQLLQKFIHDLQSRTETELDREIGNAKKIVEQYRRQRMEIIDENIVAILEKALNVALAKKLTLGDQTQLVYEALEQAKSENIFG